MFFFQFFFLKNLNPRHRSVAERNNDCGAPVTGLEEGNGCFWVWVWSTKQFGSIENPYQIHVFSMKSNIKSIFMLVGFSCFFCIFQNLGSHNLRFSSWKNTNQIFFFMLLKFSMTLAGRIWDVQHLGQLHQSLASKTFSTGKAQSDTSRS